MGTVYLNITANSGEAYSATIERMTDGFFREDDAEVFGSGLAFADKDITLTEGVSPSLGSYSGNVTADTWNDGLYKLRIHNTGIQNRVEGSNLFGIVDGEEVSVGEVNPVYHADIIFIKDTSLDKYQVRWFKNARRIKGGITSPCITVVTSSGTKLVDNESMTEIGSTGLYRYHSALQQSGGETYEVVSSGLINGGTRVFSWSLSRDV